MNTLTIPERIEQATSEVLLISAEQKEALSLIDRKTKTVSQVGGLIDLVGVFAGIKPVAFLHNQDLNIELAHTTGLSCEPIVNGLYAASRDEQLSLELRDTFLSCVNDKGRLTEEGHRAIGKLLGYPETATDYFVQRSPTVGTYDELPMVLSRSLEGTPASFFHQFVLSPDNHQQEVDGYVKPLQAAVKELAPSTYKLIEKEIRHNETRTKMGKYLRPLLGLKPKEIDPGVKKVYVD